MSSMQQASSESCTREAGEGQQHGGQWQSLQAACGCLTWQRLGHAPAECDQGKASLNFRCAALIAPWCTAACIQDRVGAQDYRGFDYESRISSQ